MQKILLGKTTAITNWSLWGAYECPLKIEYLLDRSDRLIDVNVTARDKTACAPFELATNYSSFSREPLGSSATTVHTDVTIEWPNPGFDSGISSSISVNLYEDLNSRKCIFASSDITERGSYSCIWGLMDCPVNEHPEDFFRAFDKAAFDKAGTLWYTKTMISEGK